jgi:hypothetical protein
VHRLLVTANVVPSSTIPVILKMAAIRSYERSILTKATWRNIPQDCILHSHHCEELKSYYLLGCNALHFCICQELVGAYCLLLHGRRSRRWVKGASDMRSGGQKFGLRAN